MDNAPNQTTGASSRSLCKRRMISSTCCSPLHDENFRTTSAVDTSRDAVFFCYHGRRSDRYLVRGNLELSSATVNSECR